MQPHDSLPRTNPRNRAHRRAIRANGRWTRYWDMQEGTNGILVSLYCRTSSMMVLQSEMRKEFFRLSKTIRKVQRSGSLVQAAGDATIGADRDQLVVSAAFWTQPTDISLILPTLNRLGFSNKG